MRESDAEVEGKSLSGRQGGGDLRTLTLIDNAAHFPLCQFRRLRVLLSHPTPLSVESHFF